MNFRPHRLRLAVVAAVTAVAGFGAHAAEATQWDPHAEMGTAASINTDATREPGAWVVSRGEATEFADAVSPDTMTSRAAVRQELAEARAHGLLADAGEAGATEDVWQRRAEFAAAAREPALASAAPEQDAIGEIAAASAGTPMAEGGGSMLALAPDGTMMRMPVDRLAESPPGRASLEATPATPPTWQRTEPDEAQVSEAPAIVDHDLGPRADATTLETR